MSTLNLTISTPPTLVPGAGFGGSTAQPSGSGENAIAKFITYPYQTFTGTMLAGVDAEHINGNDRVELAVNGGAWTSVTTPTYDPTTKATGYFAKLRASDFADGQIEVRSRIYPSGTGQPKVLSGLYLNANSGGTLTTLTRYADSVNGSDITGDGTIGNPYATIVKAANSLNGLTFTDAYIYCKAGTYYIQATSFPHPTTTTGYITITAAPGVARSAVVIAGLNGDTSGICIYTDLVHYQNVTVHVASGADMQIINGKTTSLFWIDNCDFIGPGRTDANNWQATGQIAGVYVNDTTFSKSKEPITNTTRTYLRNVVYNGLGQGGGQVSNDFLIVNVTVNGIDSRNTEFHAHFHQIFENSPGVVQGNGIIRNMRGTTDSSAGGGTGIISTANWPTRDLAICGCNISNNATDGAGGATVLGLCGPTQHCLIKNTTMNGPALWRDDLGFTATNVVVDTSHFPYMNDDKPHNNAGSSVVAGVTYR